MKVSQGFIDYELKHVDCALYVFICFYLLFIKTQVILFWVFELPLPLGLFVKKERHAFE